MAKIAFNDMSKYGIMLGKFADCYWVDKALNRAVHKGSGIVADKIRENIAALPEDSFRYLVEFDMFHGVPKCQKKDLAESFGLTPIDRDRDGFVHTKAGFEGYGSYPTSTYPEGVPNQILARAVESGSSVREKTPFVAPAVRATRKAAISAMEEVIDEEIKPFFN